MMANGWGSRDKTRLAIKRMQNPIKLEENPSSSSDVHQSDQEMVDVKPAAFPSVSSVSSDPVLQASPKRSIMRFDIPIKFKFH